MKREDITMLEDIFKSAAHDIDKIYDMINNCEQIQNLCMYIVRIFQKDAEIDWNHIPSRSMALASLPSKSNIYPDLPKVIHSPTILRAFYVACLRYGNSHNANNIMTKYRCIMDIDSLPYETIQLELIYHNEIYKILKRKRK